MAEHAVKKGDRIKITADSTAECLQLAEATVVDFIPGYAPGTLAALVQLDAPISFETVTGDMLVMELRFEEASWEHHGEPGTQTVGLDLYSARPAVSMDAKVPRIALTSHAVFEVLP